MQPKPKKEHIGDNNKAERTIEDDSTENKLSCRNGATCGQPDRKVQVIEVAVFLFLIVPSMSTSFLIGTTSGNQPGTGFMGVAILSILNDLGMVSLVFYFVWRNRETLRRIGWTLQNLPREVGWGLVLFFPIFYSANRLESALHSAGLSAPSKLPSFLVATGHFRLVLAVILVIVVAIVEETVFRGYKEEGTTTTPFDMVVRNDLDRFHLAKDVIDRVPKLGSRAAYARQFIRDKLLDHKNYIHRYGQDMPEIRNWKWPM